ncbi:MAG: undecaprenyl-diphosphate phosphatase [Clostridia bacterium]|nr:undecaprenyl-diphosphate phosphatase [Clostridia bacterium]
MSALLEYLKVLFLGILEGITEWLPISSTGHLLLVDEWFRLQESDAFKEVFFVVVQLGAILAVFFHLGKKLLPVKREGSVFILRKEALSLWMKVIVASLPGAVFTLLFDNALEQFLTKSFIGGRIPLMPVVIASALILYGVLFIVIEKQKKPPRLHSVEEIRLPHAFCIGLFQTLSIIPGTSRSGSTVIGAMSLGISRPAAAEFTFFLAIPAMLGYSLLKLFKFGFVFTASELSLLLTGSLAAFLTSLLVIRALMSYVKNHSFALFGIYRIALGLIVLLYFLL